MSLFPSIAIVHYHLRRGGVTRVIQTACRELREMDVPVVLVSGEPPETAATDTCPTVCVVPELGYNEHAACDVAAVQKLHNTVMHRVAATLGGFPDVWHFHNAALGKNPAVTRLVDMLAREGIPVLSQCHDFAEDQRPEEWRGLVETVGGGDVDGLNACLYPLATHARIAVLNERDRRILLQAGAPADAVVLLPNPVVAPADLEPATPDDAAAPRCWVYPTRAIRRKNLGELLLWAARTGGEDRYAATLTPTNPRDFQGYMAWKRLAQSLRLPVQFGAGLAGAKAFQKLLQGSAGLVTTSVAEGFGLAFLEPWLMAKAVVGRRLPDITDDMETAGIDLGLMYDRLDLPLEWIGRQPLLTTLAQGLAAIYGIYGVPMPADATERAMAAIVKDDRVDFGGLDEAMQETVIRRVAASREEAALLQPQTLAPETFDTAMIERNRDRVIQRYAPAAYGQRLLWVYASLLEARGEVVHLPPATVLEAFLQPERFRLLRSGA